MNYYKLQAIFLGLLLSLYGVANYVVWLTNTDRLLRKERQEFLALLAEKNLGLQQLQSTFEFPNSTIKLKILERILYPAISNIHRALASKEPKKSLSNMRLPLENVVGLFVGQKGKPYFKRGYSFKEILMPDFETQLFFGIAQKGQTFESKIEALYSYAISFEEFQKSSNQFRTLQFKGALLHRFYAVQDKFQYILLVHLNLLKDVDMQKELLEYYRSQLPDTLSLSQGDHFIGLSHEKLSQESLGLTYHFSGRSFFDECIGLWPLHLVFGLILVFLYHKGGYLLLATLFEFRLTLIYSLLCGAVYLFFFVVFDTIRSYSTTLAIRKFQQSASLQVAGIDKKFEDYLLHVAKEFHISVDQKKDYFPKDYFHEQGFKGLLFENKADKVKFSVKKDRFFLKQFLTDGSTAIISYLPESGYKRPMQVFQAFGMEPEEEIFLNQNARSKIWGRFKGRKTEGTLFPVPFLGHDIFSFWLSRGKGQDFQFYMAVIPTQAIQKYYLRWLIQHPWSQKMQIHLRQDTHSYQIYSQGGELSANDYESILRRFHAKQDSVFELQMHGMPMYGRFLNLDGLKGLQALVLETKIKVLHEVHIFEKFFVFFSILYLLLAILVCRYLVKMALKPLDLLRLGFARLQQGQSDFNLPVRGQDESALMLRQFNSMLKDMQEKEKMLPFVSKTMLEVLKTKDESSVLGSAVVLISDIRAFTSISETWEPEAVVEMLNGYFTLWQEKIEKYHGIVDRFVGDAIHVVFFEKSSRYFRENAVACALELVEALKVYNANRVNTFQVANGIGIAESSIQFQLVGEQKLEFLILGAAVDRAQDLEVKSRQGQHTHIFVEESLYLKTRFQFDYKKQGDAYELVL